MLNSVEHGILNAHKYKNIKKFSFFSESDNPRMLFFLFTNVKMPTIVGILTFMSRKIFMLNRVEHEKSFITSGPGLIVKMKIRLWGVPKNFSRLISVSPCDQPIICEDYQTRLLHYRFSG